MAQGVLVSVSTTHTVASRFPSVSKDGRAHAALNAARTRFRGVGLLLALLMLTAASPVRAVCNLANLPFGFNVASFGLSNDGAGNYIVSANSIQYAYPSAFSQATSTCNQSLGVGNGYVRYANMPAYLSLGAFRTPYTGSEPGIEVARSGTLLLLLALSTPDANIGPPAAQGGDFWVGNGQDFVQAGIPPLSSLSNGTWYLTMFLIDAATGIPSVHQNFAQPLVIGSPPPPPTPLNPTEGMWWNPSESGSGYAIAVKHGVLVMTIYSYTATGAPQWYLLVGTLANNSTTAPLSKFQNGQCISCAYRLPVVAGDDGSATVTFTSATSATLILPGGRSIQIEPQDF